MSKKGKSGGGGFSNRAARRFEDPSRIELMREDEIYDILEEDMTTILSQLTKFRNHDMGAKYPSYIRNIFVNISSAKFINEYVFYNVEYSKKGRLRTDLDEEEILSLKDLIAAGFKSSVTGEYQNQMAEQPERNEFLSEAFAHVDRYRYDVARRLKIEGKDDKPDKLRMREVIIQSYLDPVRAMRHVAKLFDRSNISEKKKRKILFELMVTKPYIPKFEKRWKKDDTEDEKVKKSKGGRIRHPNLIEAIGATLTVNAPSSDFVSTVYDFMMDQNKKIRLAYLRAYGDAFKANKTSAFQLHNEDFWKGNKRLIKKLIREDEGYRKAFKSLKGKPDKSKKTAFGEPKRTKKSYKEYAEAGAKKNIAEE